MSRIGELGSKFEKLPAVLESYEDDLEKSRGIMAIEGKTFDQAYKEQCAWPIYYGRRRQEVKTLVKYMESQVAKTRGGLYRKFVENHNRDLGERTIEKYINNEQEYLRMNELLLEVEELYEVFGAIMDAFDKRGFALRDATTARAAEFYRDSI